MRNSISLTWICSFSIGICGNNSGKNQFFSRSAHAHTDRNTHTHRHIQTQVQADLGAHPPWWTQNQTRTWALDTPCPPFTVFLFRPQFVLSSTLSCLHFRVCVCVLHWFSAYTQRCSGKRCAATKNANALTHTRTHTNALAQHAKS